MVVRRVLYCMAHGRVLSQFLPMVTCIVMYCMAWYGIVCYGMAWRCASSSLLNHLQLFCLLPVISIEPPATSLEGNKVKTKNSYISFQ